MANEEFTELDERLENWTKTHGWHLFCIDRPPSPNIIFKFMLPNGKMVQLVQSTRSGDIHEIRVGGRMTCGVPDMEFETGMNYKD